MNDEAPSQRRGRIYWPLVFTSLGLGVIAVPIGFFVTVAYAFSGWCSDSDTNCPGPEPASHYVATLVVLSTVWVVFAAIVLHNRADTIPFPAVLIGLVAALVVFHGLLWSGLYLALELRSRDPIGLMILAPFAAALLGGCTASLIWRLGAVTRETYSRAPQAASPRAWSSSQAAG